MQNSGFPLWPRKGWDIEKSNDTFYTGPGQDKTFLWSKLFWATYRFTGIEKMHVVAFKNCKINVVSQILIWKLRPLYYPSFNRRFQWGAKNFSVLSKNFEKSSVLELFLHISFHFLCQHCSFANRKSSKTEFFSKFLLNTEKFFAPHWKRLLKLG